MYFLKIYMNLNLANSSLECQLSVSRKDDKHNRLIAFARSCPSSWPQLVLINAARSSRASEKRGTGTDEFYFKECLAPGPNYEFFCKLFTGEPNATFEELRLAKKSRSECWCFSL